MAKVKKRPYYKLESSMIPFTRSKWKCYLGSRGCVPISSPQKISFARPAPGTEFLSHHSKIIKSDSEPAQTAPAAIEPGLLPKQEKSPSSNNLQQDTPKIETEYHEKLPIFDLQDVCAAMENIGWPVSAKLARRWFRSPKHIWDDNLNSIQPIDDSTVDFNWALKFGTVRDKCNELLSEWIYNQNAIKVLEKKLKPIFYDDFQNALPLVFNTTKYIQELRSFHINWHFQRIVISDFDTTESAYSMTDLTGSLGNFIIYAAIGHVTVGGDKYYKYDNKENTKTYCIDAKASITHVYVYLKDNYSFNDKTKSKTQYLGHWNKKGFVITTGALISEFIDGTMIKTKMNNSPQYRASIDWDYLMNEAMKDPIDIRKGVISAIRPDDVFYPVYNKTYNDWREHHNRGGDFMIYSKPKYMKLKKPIELPLGTICRLPEKM